MNRHLAQLSSRLRAVEGEQWFLMVFSVLLALFVFVLLTESTSVGRGGR